MANLSECKENLEPVCLFNSFLLIISPQIDRELGFETVKKDVSKWDPIVFDNRTSDQIKFPLKQIDVDAVEDEQKKEKSHHAFLNTFRVGILVHLTHICTGLFFQITQEFLEGGQIVPQKLD